MLPSILLESVKKSQYRDLKYGGAQREHENALSTSTTLYVGNLSFFTREEQIFELFSTCGELKQIIMGLDRHSRTPCGFCFVEYYERSDAQKCVYYINGSRLDDRVIRVDWDAGFKEGRQFGRGKGGGQVRDEYRTDFDPARGGYGKLAAQQRGGAGVPPPVGAGGVAVEAAAGPPAHAVGEKRERGDSDDEAEPHAKRQRAGDI
eukprot:TRINITY_DN5584_c0_g1_i1.p1 TRINITY_DN5584_c0_g1~~TRINITY_DN5584_c0_g1_i1.p1  ORF type:complete len:205 (-),score=68.89 TRINITY_DN5584_c0_g1_i1:304-918(-)